MPVSISTNTLTKDFASVRALNGVTTNIEKGEIRGLLGPNGSGKSTFMKILMGLIKPDYGRATVEGLDPSKDPIAVRQRVGYVPETPRLYDFLTGLEYLDRDGQFVFRIGNSPLIGCAVRAVVGSHEYDFCGQLLPVIFELFPALETKLPYENNFFPGDFLA